MSAQFMATPAANAFERLFIAAAKSTRTGAASMRLQAVRLRGQVVDFVWESTTSAAAHLLRCDPAALLGRRLREVAAVGPLGHPALIDRYRRVLEHGNAQSFEQVHVVEGRQELVIHRVVPVNDGVNVTLTNLSADRRAQIARLQVHSLRASLREIPR